MTRPQVAIQWLAFIVTHAVGGLANEYRPRMSIVDEMPVLRSEQTLSMLHCGGDIATHNRTIQASNYAAP